MSRLFTLLLLISVIGCSKDEEISKARTLWGDWQATETKIIYDDLKGQRISTTTTDFEISFFHTNKGHITGLNNLDFIWAVQDDPNALLISPQLFSVDSTGEFHLNTSDLFYIGEFSHDQIKLHNEYVTYDSIKSTIERNWTLNSIE